MWLDQQVSLYECAADNRGIAATYRQILLSRFAIDHNSYYKTYPVDKVAHPKGEWINGITNDLRTITLLRGSNLTKPEQVLLKQTMQCFTPAGLLKTKKQGSIEEICRTGILQLDFDYNDIRDYDIEELKQCVFNLPFIAFCGLSCSGKGFYALAAIAEPDKLKEYAEHCFNVLLDVGIKADTSKGRNVQDLRFVSYDPNMLIREDPSPLTVKRFKRPKQPQRIITPGSSEKLITANDGRIKKGLQALKEAQPGQRWHTVQKVSFTLGGLGINDVLLEIINCIKANAAFAGEEDKYIECAEVCFNKGLSQPLPLLTHNR